MTIIDTQAGIDTHATGSSVGITALPSDRTSAIGEWLTTTDHKRIGRMFISVSLTGLLGVIVVATLLGIDRIDAEASMLDVNSVPQLFALYRVGLTFVVLVPLLLGIAIAVVPLQLGARSLTFPRLAAAGFWSWFVGAVLVVISIASNGGPSGGNTRFVALFLVSLITLLLGLIAAAGSLATHRAHRPCARHEHAPGADVRVVGAGRFPRSVAGASSGAGCVDLHLRRLPIWPRRVWRKSEGQRLDRLRLHPAGDHCLRRRRVRVRGRSHRCRQRSEVAETRSDLHRYRPPRNCRYPRRTVAATRDVDARRRCSDLRSVARRGPVVRLLQPVAGARRFHRHRARRPGPAQ